MITQKLLIGLTIIAILSLTLVGLRTRYEAHSALPAAALGKSTHSDTVRPPARLRFLLGAVDDWQGSAEGSGLTDFIQASRLTVTQIDDATSRILTVDMSGDLRWVTVDRQTAELEPLNPGDSVRVEALDGARLKVVVLRRAWDELASFEN